MPILKVSEQFIGRIKRWNPAKVVKKILGNRYSKDFSIYFLETFRNGTLFKYGSQKIFNINQFCQTIQD